MRCKLAQMQVAWVGLFLSATVLCNAYESSDYVPAARRSQYSASRTSWHDLLSRHCPRFGVDRVTVIPLPQPKGFTAEVDSFKIQLSFQGDRFVTSWIRLMGKGAPEVPYVHVLLTGRGPALVAVKAEVTPVPHQYLVTHHMLLEEFQNATHWPKHLLVQYRWTHLETIKAQAGLYTIFGAGLVVAWILLFNVVWTYQQKLQSFLTDVLGEGNNLLAQPKAD